MQYYKYRVCVCRTSECVFFFFFFQAEDGIRDLYVTGVQTCALPISCACSSRTYLLNSSKSACCLALSSSRNCRSYISISFGSSNCPKFELDTECGRYLPTSASGLTTFWQLPSAVTSKLPLRSASNHGPVGNTRWVTCSPILLHWSTTQIP